MSTNNGNGLEEALRKVQVWYSRAGLPVPEMSIEETDAKMAELCELPVYVLAFAHRFNPVNSYFVRLCDAGHPRRDALAHAAQYELECYGPIMQAFRK